MPKKRDYQNWSREELVREVVKLEKRKKYGMVWEDKPEKVAELCNEKLPVFKEEKRKEIITQDGSPVNILVEGDNYHALSVLNYTHRGRVDVIYIDPPYNTGNEGFLYNDRIVDKEDPYRHSKWLSFMSKRLNLAKNLLKGSGLLFVSIDENEYSQLKLLCDEILGEKNYRNTILLRRYDKNINRQFMTGGLASFNIGVEYVLIYSKRSDAKLKPIFREASEERQTKGYWKGFWNDADRPTMRYDILGVTPESGQWKWKKEVAYEAIENYKEYLEKHSKKLSLEDYWKKTGKNKKFIRRKNGGNGKNRGVEHWVAPTSEILRNTNWYDVFASKPIQEGVSFNNPKNPDAIKELIKMSYNDDAIVLDFFAGSGTTARSVLELNKEDGGKRMFILCTNNENDICSEICLPRVKKMIKGFSKNGKSYKGLGGNLKFYSTKFVDAKPTDRNKKQLVDNSTEMLCLKESCFDEVTKGKEYKIFKNVEGKYLGIVYDDDGIESLKKEVRKLHNKIVVYVFSLDDSAREEEFEDLNGLVELKPIPSVILNIYKRIFKRSK